MALALLFVCFTLHCQLSTWITNLLLNNATDMFKPPKSSKDSVKIAQHTFYEATQKHFLCAEKTKIRYSFNIQQLLKDVIFVFLAQKIFP